ncbi:MAG: hypothetical protein AAGF13_11265, partial [Pseudomonadota bacterium]
APAAARGIPLGSLTIFNLSSLAEGAFSPVPAGHGIGPMSLIYQSLQAGKARLGHSHGPVALATTQ